MWRAFVVFQCSMAGVVVLQRLVHTHGAQTWWLVAEERRGKCAPVQLYYCSTLWLCRNAAQCRSVLMQHSMCLRMQRLKPHVAPSVRSSRLRVGVLQQYRPVVFKHNKTDC